MKKYWTKGHFRFFIFISIIYIYIHTFINKNSYNYIILKKFIEFLYLFIQAKD